MYVNVCVHIRFRRFPCLTQTWCSYFPVFFRFLRDVRYSASEAPGCMYKYIHMYCIGVLMCVYTFVLDISHAERKLSVSVFLCIFGSYGRALFRVGSVWLHAYVHTYILYRYVNVCVYIRFRRFPCRTKTCCSCVPVSFVFSGSGVIPRR